MENRNICTCNSSTHIINCTLMMVIKLYEIPYNIITLTTLYLEKWVSVQQECRLHDVFVPNSILFRDFLRHIFLRRFRHMYRLRNKRNTCPTVGFCYRQGNFLILVLTPVWCVWATYITDSIFLLQEPNYRNLITTIEVHPIWNGCQDSCPGRTNNV
jgi:hypothetical protein